MTTSLACIAAMACATAACTAGLAFEKTLIEFHPKPDTEQVTAEFAFRNNGDKPVRIVKFDAACSCMNVGAVNGKLNYAPGEVGTIRAVFNLAGYYGTIDRVVAVWLEGDPLAAPSARLTVRAHIPQLIKMDPKTLHWELHKAPVPQTISINMDEEKKIHILGTQSTSDNFTLELKTLEAGRKYELVVTPKKTDIPGIAIFRMETDCEAESERIQTAFGVIRNPPR